MVYVKLPSGTILETETPEIWKEGERISAKAGKAALRQEAIDRLKELLKPGDTVTTVLRHVSSSGMSRRIILLICTKDGPFNISFLAARAMDNRINRDEGSIVIGGCGMDMGFALVYNLGRTLWPNGDGATVIGRNGDKQPETDGGYLLKQRWL